jgi:hypothetical protein
MPKEGPLEGTLAETPFARLLFDLWRQERSGRLTIRGEKGERNIFFEKGHLLIAQDGPDPKDFLSALVRKKVLSEEQAGRAERLAEARNISLFKSLGELGFLSPIPLWSLAESFYTRRLYSLFDREEGDFAFDSAAVFPGSHRLGRLQTPDLILEGIRQMHNNALIVRGLPGEEEPIRVSAPIFLPLLKFEPPERYALQILADSGTIRRFHERSELGDQENRKVLFAFACLGILAPAESAAKTASSLAVPGAEQGRILEALNEKCAFIFKFVSKEIGPVAGSVLSRALDEVRPSLGPMFQKMALQFDGRVEVDAALRLSVEHLPEEVFRTIVQGYDEILTGEVLAVKKTLGAAQETALVRNLEKIGCV